MQDSSLGLGTPKRGANPRRERSFHWSYVVAFAAALLLAVVATALDDWPPPRVFDEFSLILAGDTYAHGRLTNPPHALPEFFDTIHVLQRPTYASKYFPGYGLGLAMGILLGGGARLGQWLMFASMAPALLWMMRGWLTPRAASLAAAFPIILLADSAWASGFWGASFTVTGSALTFGAVGRFARREDVPNAGVGVLLGSGVALMAMTRPFEGLALCVPCALYVAWWCLRPSPLRGRRLLHVAAPATLVLAAAGVLVLAQNRAVTGSIRHSGYGAYESTAPGAPPFVWQDLQPATRSLRANQRARMKIDIDAYGDVREWWSREMRVRFFEWVVPSYFVHVIFVAPLLLAPLAIRDRTLLVPAAAVISVAAAVSVLSFFIEAYISPAIPPIALLYAVGCGVLARATFVHRRMGVWGARLLLAAFAFVGTARIAVRNHDEDELTKDVHWSRRRQALQRYLSSTRGQHLIFVHYGESYRVQDEWVQNSADMKKSPVLWAHDLGDAENARLIAAEPNRVVWRVVLERRSVAAPRLTRYSDPASPISIPPDPHGWVAATPPY